jgi:hypothetical protein
MFLSAYHFDGRSDQLLAAYQRMMAGFPTDQIELHACVAHDAGITVFDGCPSYQEFVEFSTSEGFLGAVRAAGLPAPRIEPLGEVRAVHAKEAAPR